MLEHILDLRHHLSQQEEFLQCPKSEFVVHLWPDEMQVTVIEGSARVKLCTNESIAYPHKLGSSPLSLQTGGYSAQNSIWEEGPMTLLCILTQPNKLRGVANLDFVYIYCDGTKHKNEMKWNKMKEDIPPVSRAILQYPIGGTTGWMSTSVVA